MELVVSFTSQVYLSQVHPKNYKSIAHLDPNNTSQYFFPDQSYGYTVLEPYQMGFDKPVQVEFFWLRLHKPKEFYQ
jgi:hypothetical protein